MKYHNTPTGPMICDAKIRACKYLAAGADHFDTQKEAWVAYEKTMSEAFGMVPRPNIVRREIQKFYRDIDNIRLGVRMVKNAALKTRATALSTIRSAQQSARATQHETRRKVRSYIEGEYAKQEAVREKVGAEASKPKLYAFSDSTFSANPRIVMLTEEQLNNLQQLMPKSHPSSVQDRLKVFYPPEYGAPKPSVTRSIIPPLSRETQERIKQGRRKAALFLFRGLARAGKAMDNYASRIIASKLA